MKRDRKAKIVATLGPSTSTHAQIEAIFKAGVDVFRLNFSHGTHADHAQRIQIIRELETIHGRPTTILMDLQGPKIRVGTFENDSILLKKGDVFTLDEDKTPGNQTRVCLPHPEIFKALRENTILLLDDGKIRLEITSISKTSVQTRVIIGGTLSNRKGVNIPDIVLPISAMTEKDREDLNFGLSHNVDWVALSFVQTPQDILEAREIIQNKARIIAKIEKPRALEHLEEIIELSDALMVARGDLGVEMPLETIPGTQKKIIQSCRFHGKPVIIATQMLESMILAPSPTRAEISDIATAIYDGADGVMLSAESASGQFPIESVEMMDRIICHVERDPLYYEKQRERRHTITQRTVADAIVTAAREVSQTIDVPCIITFTESGSTTLRAARERPKANIMAMTPNLTVARQLGLVWGVFAQLTEEVFSFSKMVKMACKEVQETGFATPDSYIVVIAGVPFGESGGTNILRVVHVGSSLTQE